MKLFFHRISYLQYALYLASVIFYIPFINSLLDRSPDLEALNYVLILFGVGISFSTLQDTTKTQNKASKKIWQSESKGKVMLVIIAVMAFSFITTGLFLLFNTASIEMENISIGVTVLGIGLVGVLKAAIEMFENHRIRKN